MVKSRVRCMIILSVIAHGLLGSITLAQDKYAPVLSEVKLTLEAFTPGTTITVNIGAEKDRYTSGEPIEIRFRASQACSPIVMEIAPTDEIRFLIPNGRAKQPTLEAGRVYSTSQDFQIDLTASATPGDTVFNLLCSPQRLNLFDADFTENTPYYTIKPTDAKRLQALLDRLTPLHAQECSGSSLILPIIDAAPVKTIEETSFPVLAPASAPASVQVLFYQPRGALNAPITTERFFPPIGVTGTTGKTE